MVETVLKIVTVTVLIIYYSANTNDTSDFNLIALMVAEIYRGVPKYTGVRRNCEDNNRT